MKQKAINFYRKNKMALMMGAVLLAASPAHAAMDADLSAGLTAASTQAKADIMGGVAIVAPIALAIGGLFLAWKKGWGFFKSVAK